MKPLGLIYPRHPMGNRYTKSPFFTREDKPTTVSFPTERLETFRKAAKAEGLSFSRWAFYACEAHLATSRDRVRAAKAVK